MLVAVRARLSVLISTINTMSLSKKQSLDPVVTPENVAEVLAHDRAVKVAGCDIDGIMRGKMMAKSKFVSLVKGGKSEFGFCSVIFGWDMHDQTYIRELSISNKENGYRDVVAKIDLKSFRRIPWEHNVPFFLINFHDPDTAATICACPRSTLARTTEALAERGMTAMAGGWYHFLDSVLHVCLRTVSKHARAIKNTW